MKAFETPTRLAGASLWLALSLGAMAVVTRWSLTPGEAAALPWRSVREPARGAPALSVFIHPRCPCSRATLAELERMLARTPVDATVWFMVPRGADGAWRTSANWRLAQTIHGVRARVDLDGREARRMGAHTSGEVMLVGASGRVRFHGGITPARGHEGDSAGRRALETLLRAPEDRAEPVATARTYGCSLDAESAVTP